MDPRADNFSERSVVELLTQREQVSVAELAQHLELSPSTAVGILTRLLDRGSVRRCNVSEGRRGRPTFRYGLRIPAPLAAFLFDGTQLAGAVFGTDFEPQARRVLPIAQVNTRKRAVELVRETLLALCDEARVTPPDLYGVALSINAVRTRRFVYASSVMNWVDGTLEGFFSQELAIPTRLTRHPQLLAEYRQLPEPRPASMVYLHAADGVSAHWSAFGKAARGHSNRSGELGHVVVDADGPLCGCGRRGCLEAFCSGPSIYRQMLQAAGAARTRSALDAARATSPRAAIEQLWQTWQAKDPFARKIIDPVLDRLAWGLGLAVNLIDPELIIAGGYVLANKPEWIEQVQRRAQPWILHAGTRSVEIVPGGASLEDELRVIASQYHARVGPASKR